MTTTLESTHQFDIAPDPEGPMTLRQHIDLTEFAAAVTKRVSHGNGFIAPGMTERQRDSIENLRAKMASAVEKHPVLVALNGAHEKLLNALRRAEISKEENVSRIRELCAGLAQEIVDLEKGEPEEDSSIDFPIVQTDVIAFIPPDEEPPLDGPDSA